MFMMSWQSVVLFPYIADPVKMREAAKEGRCWYEDEVFENQSSNTWIIFIGRLGTHPDSI